MKTAENRRKEILEILKQQDQPVSASRLAARFQVSRQIVVGDIALLRAAGEDIYATPKGYLAGHRSEGLEKTVVCNHTAEQTELELNICVDNGCIVENVLVEHPLYGQLEGQLGLHSRHDVKEFVEKAAAYHASLLSDLTGGIHLHVLRCPDEASYERVCRDLRAEGILYEEE